MIRHQDLNLKISLNIRLKIDNYTKYSRLYSNLRPNCHLYDENNHILRGRIMLSNLIIIILPLLLAGRQAGTTLNLL